MVLDKHLVGWCVIESGPHPKSQILVLCSLHIKPCLHRLTFRLSNKDVE